MSRFLCLLLLLFPAYSFPQDSLHKLQTDTLSLLFIGDIMGHDSQIKSAYDAETGAYDYEDNFMYVKDEITKAALCIANFEVTLAGPPYKGYPSFSSPDELAVACKNSGMDVFALANNHICDKGLKGLNRTLKTLDTIGVQHTGAFSDSADRSARYPMIIEKNNFRLSLLNYTYHTNYYPPPPPAVVNLIDTVLIKKDLACAQQDSTDFIIVFFHWGKEYDTVPNNKQTALADFCFSNGADAVIGSHPHVLQKVVWQKDSSGKDRFAAYSLGNFLSNQYWRKVDGGMMLKMTLVKDGDETTIDDAAYILSWVYRKQEDTGRTYHVLPCSRFENDTGFFNEEFQFKKMKLFIDDSRKLMQEQNQNVFEFFLQKDAM